MVIIPEIMTKETPSFSFLSSLRKINQLVAIYPGGGTITSVIGNARECSEWAEDHNGRGANIYFAINPVKEGTKRKATKADLVRAEFAHVDIDPPKGVEYSVGREGLLARVGEWERAGPRWIIDSGNGIQLVFELSRPTSDFGAVEAANQRLMEKYGGDKGTWNVDRIFRLPGTLNYPDARKLERGYPAEPREAKLLYSAESWEVFPVRAEAEWIRRLLKVEEFRRFWDKGEAVPGQHDTTGSGFDFELAGWAKEAGVGYEDFAAVKWVWGSKGGRDERYLRRCWDRVVVRGRVKEDPAAEFKSVKKEGGLVCLGELTKKPIEWLWTDHLARGKLHLIAGRPGTMKTTIGLDLLARATRGAEWPSEGFPGKPCNVALWSGEDDMLDTLLPRLEAAGADLSRVFTPPATYQVGEKKRCFDILRDLPFLEALLKEKGNVGLVMIDPIMAVSQGEGNDNADTRKSLQPLVRMAESVGCAVVGITHFSKGTQGKDVVERVTGSHAWAAVARVVFAAVEDKEESGSYVFSRVKCNIAPLNGAIRYSCKVVELDQGIKVTRIVWGETEEGNPQEIVDEAEGGGSEEGPGRPAEAITRAMAALTELLKDGARPVSDAEQLAENLGVSWRTMRRVKAQLRVVARKEGGVWVWEMS